MLCPAVPPIFGLFLWLLTKPCRGNGRQLRLTYSGGLPFWDRGSPGVLSVSVARMASTVPCSLVGAFSRYFSRLERLSMVIWRFSNAKKASRRSLSKTPLPLMDAIIYTLRTFVNLRFTQLFPSPLPHLFTLMSKQKSLAPRKASGQNRSITAKEAFLWDWS